MSYAPDFSTSRYGYVGTYTYTDTDGEVRTQTYNPYEGLPYSFSVSYTHLDVYKRQEVSC